jgi:putative DNA primase/helicase
VLVEGGMNDRTAQYVKAYVRNYHLALVPIPRGSKGPRREGWNKPGGYFTDAEEALRYWREHPEDGIGAVLGPSGLCSLDVDHVEHAMTVLSEFGVDLDALSGTAPTVQGKPARLRILFAAPTGGELSRHALTWPARSPDEKPLTILELRAGDVQDVLPPTIHPGTGKEYTWCTRPNGSFPALPEALLTLWRDWPTFERMAKSLCHWAPAPTPTLRMRHDESVIDAFNARHTVVQLPSATATSAKAGDSSRRAARAGSRASSSSTTGGASVITLPIRSPRGTRTMRSTYSASSITTGMPNARQPLRRRNLA